MRRGFAKFLAAIIAILFVVTAAAANILYNIDLSLFAADTYKSALTEQQVYKRLPRVLAEQIVFTLDTNPCENNPLLCEGLPPEIQRCYLDALGEERHAQLASGLDPLTAEDYEALDPCLDEYYDLAPPHLVEKFNQTNALAQAPENVRVCVSDSIGLDAYEQLRSRQRRVSAVEAWELIDCFEFNGEDLEHIGRPPTFVDSLKVTDWEMIIGALLPPEAMQVIANKVVDDTLAFLGGESKEISISLVELKRNISGEPGLRATINLLRSKPACTEAESETLQASLRGEADATVICKPGEDILIKMSPDLQAQLNMLAEAIPAQTPLITTLDIEGMEDDPQTADAVSGIHQLRYALLLSPLIPLGLMLLITLLAIRSLRDWLRWWGVPVFFAGLTNLVLAILFSVSIPDFWPVILSQEIPASLSTGLLQLMLDILTSISGKLVGNILLGSILLLSTGLALWIVSGFRKKAQTAES
ncbi:MAG: hypothetical protein JXA13_14255 [Anaerolineales bacterium]|nr:hypothetical protein [Anaerolineales bacterium]